MKVSYNKILLNIQFKYNDKYLICVVGITLEEDFNLYDFFGALKELLPLNLILTSVSSKV